MFLLSDTQIINETFLEDINNILNAGEVVLVLLQTLSQWSPLHAECSG